MAQLRQQRLLNRYLILLIGVGFLTTASNAYMPAVITTSDALRHPFLQATNYHPPLLHPHPHRHSTTRMNYVMILYAAAGKGMGKSVATNKKTSSLNWCPTPIPISDIPTTENQVVLLETQLPSLKNAQTNPMGAIAVTKYNGQTYCFDVACPSCKIPLTKAKCTTIPDPDDDDPTTNYVLDVISCDFCKNTYDLATGERLAEPAVPPGFFGQIAQKLFSSQPGSGLMKFYKLGEQGGKVLISFD